MKKKKEKAEQEPQLIIAAGQQEEQPETEDVPERLRPVLEALEKRYGVRAEEFDGEKLAEMILEGLEKQTEDEEKILRHLESLLAEEEKLRETVPGFALLAALEDPRFLRLTAPHTGLSLEDAYYALNRVEISRAAAREGLEALSRSIRSGGDRPRELKDSHGAGFFSPDPRSMTKQERDALKKRIYDAAARNEKLFP